MSLMSQATIKRQHLFTPVDSPIFIGRTADCKVRFKEGALSRVQCCITYVGGNTHMSTAIVETTNNIIGGSGGSWML